MVVCHEALCLDSLEDFNATEADLMDMKNKILAMWKSRDRRRTLSPQTHHSLPHPWTPRNKDPPWGKTFTSGRAATSISAPHGPSYSLGKTSSPFFSLWPHHPKFPLHPGYHLIYRSFLPTSYPTVGTPMEYNFDPMTGQPLKLLISSTYSLPSQPFGASFSTPTSPGMTGLSTLPGLSKEVIGTVYPNIPLSSASLHSHPRSSLGATLGVRMSTTAYGNLSTMSSVWPIGTSRLNLRPRSLSI